MTMAFGCLYISTVLYSSFLGRTGSACKTGSAGRAGSAGVATIKRSSYIYAAEFVSYPDDTDFGPPIFNNCTLW